MYEVEKKAYLRKDVLDEIKKISDFKYYSEKKDSYFTNVKGRKVNIYIDPVFRIREEKEKRVLSYKDKSFDNKTEVNKEYEIDITGIDLEKIKDFFEYMGIYKFIEKTKKTSLYTLTNYKGFDINIECNQIEGIGDFVEVEIIVDDERRINNAVKVIDELFKEIGIKDDEIEERYYIDILMEKENEVFNCR